LIPETLAKRTWLLALVILVGVGAVLYYKPMSGRYFFGGPDALAPTAIGAGLKAVEQETGEVPLWKPWLFAGMPTQHAFTNVSRLYHPTVILKGLTVLGLPGFWAFFVHVIFAGFGGYLLIIYLGGSFGAGLLAGSGFMLMPYFNTMLVHGHGSQMMTLAYLPWLVWALLRLYDSPTGASAALLALLTGFSLQRGHAQISYYLLMMVGLLFLVAAVKSWRDNRSARRLPVRFIALFGVTMAAGIGLAMRLYLPVMNYTPFSIRGAQTGGGTGFEYATQWSFSFGETLTFLLPSFYGFGGVTYWGAMPFTDYPNYMGILLLLLAVWTVIFRRNWLTWTLAVGGGLAYLISLGNNFFIYKLFYLVLPYFNKFRVPSMILVLTQFSVVVLAGLGVDGFLTWLKDMKAAARKKVFLGLWAGLGVLVILFLVAPSIITFPQRPGIPPQYGSQIDQLRAAMMRVDAVWLLAIGGLAVAGLYMWRQGRLSKVWFMGGLVVLTMVDLGRIDRQIIQPPEKSLRGSVLQPVAMKSRYLNSDQVIDYLKADTAVYRIYPLGRLQNDNRWAAFGIASITGYHPAKLANYDQFMKATGFRSGGILRMLNVKYFVSQQRFRDPRFEEVFVGNLYHGGQYQPAAVYRFREHMERAWFPAAVTTKATAEEIYQAVSAADYDPAQVIYLTMDVDDPAIQAGAGKVVEASFAPNHIRLKVETERSGLLVLSEIYYPLGWVARIDGAKTPVYQVNTILRGVLAPEGVHTVTFDFEPGDIRLGRWISNLSLILIVMGFIPALVQRVKERT